KIIVGREEIDRFGDSTLGDVLKRLPGVTIQGRPGRGGAIRLRGLGNGYTQILLDAERVPPGFSLDSPTPDQIERIEILRAPTAAVPPPYDTAVTTARTGTSLARLNSEWTHRFGPQARVEWRAGIGQALAPVNSFRTEFTNVSESRTLEETSRSHDTTLTAGG